MLAPTPSPALTVTASDAAGPRRRQSTAAPGNLVAVLFVAVVVPGLLPEPCCHCPYTLAPATNPTTRPAPPHPRCACALHSLLSPPPRAVPSPLRPATSPLLQPPSSALTRTSPQLAAPAALKRSRVPSLPWPRPSSSLSPAASCGRQRCRAVCHPPSHRPLDSLLSAVLAGSSLPLCSAAKLPHENGLGPARNWFGHSAPTPTPALTVTASDAAGSRRRRSTAVPGNLVAVLSVAAVVPDLLPEPRSHCPYTAVPSPLRPATSPLLQPPSSALARTSPQLAARRAGRTDRAQALAGAIPPMAAPLLLALSYSLLRPPTLSRRLPPTQSPASRLAALRRPRRLPLTALLRSQAAARERAWSRTGTPATASMAPHHGLSWPRLAPPGTPPRALGRAAPARPLERPLSANRVLAPVAPVRPQRPNPLWPLAH
nr:proline-rich protein 36-like [Aegilops tauschii subsp. strangulata]